jgi:hypothetical protein
MNLIGLEYFGSMDKFRWIGMMNLLSFEMVSYAENMNSNDGFDLRECTEI